MTATADRTPVRRVQVVDSHTEGEPTRVVVRGGPELGDGPLPDRRDRFRAGHDRFRRALVTEPRGTEGMVGALLCAPHDPASAFGVIFFDNAGYLGMCGHGTIGLVVTLAHLGRLTAGRTTIDTPVGPVPAELHADGTVTFWNVASFRRRAAVPLDVPGFGSTVGDVAWGGNWFFLIDSSPVALRVDHAETLTGYCRAVRAALARSAITGDGGAPIDHIELSGPAERSENDARNFVLCPGDAYDRSPCGTGTSAKMACLVADGRLKEGTSWRQEGILGGVFEGRADPSPSGIRPRITGVAHITGEAELLLDDRDPLGYGVPP
ncbi:MAG: proline racemase family protein [Thermoplasmata archaeon]|nr:proline racemase family protein [Thermoplasmata archaeon]